MCCSRRIQIMFFKTILFGVGIFVSFFLTFFFLLLRDDDMLSRLINSFLISFTVSFTSSFVVFFVINSKTPEDIPLLEHTQPK